MTKSAESARILRIEFRADGAAVILWSDEQVFLWDAEHVQSVVRSPGRCKQAWHRTGERICARCEVREAWKAYHPIDPPGQAHGYGTTFGSRNGRYMYQALAAAMVFIGAACCPRCIEMQVVPDVPAPVSTPNEFVCMHPEPTGNCSWWVRRDLVVK